MNWQSADSSSSQQQASSDASSLSDGIQQQPSTSDAPSLSGSTQQRASTNDSLSGATPLSTAPLAASTTTPSSSSPSFSVSCDNPTPSATNYSSATSNTPPSASPLLTTFTELSLDPSEAPDAVNSGEAGATCGKETNERGLSQSHPLKETLVDVLYQPIRREMVYSVSQPAEPQRKAQVITYLSILARDMVKMMLAGCLYH